MARQATLGPHPLARLQHRRRVFLCCSLFDLLGFYGPSLVFGSVFMLALMSAGVGPFAMLFRAAQSRSLDGGEARQFFLASALGTLAGVAPVLAIDLRWGVPGTALVAGLAYALVFGVAVILASERSRPNQR